MEKHNFAIELKAKMGDNSSLQIVTVATQVDERIEVLRNSCIENKLSLTILGEGETWTSYLLKLRLFLNHLKKQSPDQLVIFVDAFDVYIDATEKELIHSFESFQSNIVFAAESNFIFKDSSLKYYYWKYYPRKHKLYNYLNSGTFIGKTKHLISMIEEISNAYNLDLLDDETMRKLNCDQTLFSRYFVDLHYQSIDSENSIELDYDQQLFACTGGRQRVFNWPLVSWIQSFLFFKYERKLLKVFGLQNQQNSIADLKYKNGKFVNLKTGSHPLVLHMPRTEDRIKKHIKRIKSGNPNLGWLNPVVLLISLVAYLGSFCSFLLIFFINLGVTSPKRIFRFSKNQNEEYDSSINTFLQFLKEGKPFAFAHFNDGELTFIKKFQLRKTKETSYGRGQQTYDNKLGERLAQSIGLKIPNYFVGVPCSTCWPEHRSLADEITEDSHKVVPAMTFHHNLSFLPSFIHLLKDKNCFFMGNSKQHLDKLERLGLKIKDENRIEVPFKNSYNLFDELKGKIFPTGSIVLLNCGMLAKIIIPEWFKLNPSCTFIAFGSALDDLIQEENSRYILFPKNTPFTANIYPTKFFLFGRKKLCKECFPKPQ